MSAARGPGGRNPGEGFAAAMGSLTLHDTNRLEPRRPDMQPQTPVSQLRSYGSLGN